MSHSLEIISHSIHMLYHFFIYLNERMVMVYYLFDALRRIRESFIYHSAQSFMLGGNQEDQFRKPTAISMFLENLPMYIYTFHVN